ncbi:MAG: SHOCT domain-containing protein [Dehalococcoidales bacterium]|nr:SHOCT domain-containing protein [Dehalococcoidales bacterium]
MDKSLKTVLIIGGIIVAVFAILSVVPGLLWGGQYGGWGMMGPGMMGGYGTMFLMPVLWIVVLGLIIWAVVAAVRPGESNRSDSAAYSSALDVLKKRYARGEINKEEYEEKKRDLA